MNSPFFGKQSPRNQEQFARSSASPGHPTPPTREPPSGSVSSTPSRSIRVKSNARRWSTNVRSMNARQRFEAAVSRRETLDDESLDLESLSYQSPRARTSTVTAVAPISVHSQRQFTFGEHAKDLASNASVAQLAVGATANGKAPLSIMRPYPTVFIGDQAHSHTVVKLNLANESKRNLMSYANYKNVWNLKVASTCRVLQKLNPLLAMVVFSHDLALSARLFAYFNRPDMDLRLPSLSHLLWSNPNAPQEDMLACIATLTTLGCAST